MQRRDISMTNKQTEVSIIFPVKNEGVNVRNTLDSLFSTKTSIPFETIIIDDGSEDGCCNFLNNYKYKDKIQLIKTQGVGPSNARNIGAKHAKNKYLIFCDAHLSFQPLWIDKLLFTMQTKKADAICPGISSMEDPGKTGYGQTLNPNLRIKWHKIRAGVFQTAIIPGGCFIVTKSAFQDVGGFETGFKSWGHEDIELSIKLWLFGYTCYCDPSVKILHLFRNSHPYKVEYDGFYYNLLRMAYLHFNENRIKRTKKLIVHSNSNKIENAVLKDEVLKKRKDYLQRRFKDDEWFFKKFNIDF
jgi:glycosyltransferase involved in cell wall biosynthesis